MSVTAARSAHAAVVRAPPALAVATLGAPPRRSYMTRQHIDRHMQRLQDLANSSSPARKKAGFQRRSKIVCTIGPKIANEDDIRCLMRAGMNVARFNFSHGEYSWFAETITLIRNIKEDMGRDDVAIALDTKGPEIRTGQLARGTPSGDPGFALSIAAGQSLVFHTDPGLAAAGSADAGVFIDYAAIGETLRPGDAMMLDDGLLGFTVEESGAGWVRAIASNAGALGERKGVNLPGAEVALPAVSEKDAADLAFGVAQGVDLIFASFVRKAEHVKDLRAALAAMPTSGRVAGRCSEEQFWYSSSGCLAPTAEERAEQVKIIAKIENQEGVRNFDEILAVADGIMVARGDLGIEIPAPKVFVAQKMMVQKCNLAGKPVICATQMLDSMITMPRPTRAEVSDVANAVLDGSDAVMLSGETAKGLFPEAAVLTMGEIVREAEASMDHEDVERRQQLMMPKRATSVEAVCAAAARIAQDQGASLVVVVTETGEAPQLMAKYRPTVPIVAICVNERVARQCALLRGVIPLVVPWRGAVGSEFATVSVTKVLRAALRKVVAMGIAAANSMEVTSGRAVVLHDADITDQVEMEDWVLRIVDLEVAKASSGKKIAS